MTYEETLAKYLKQFQLSVSCAESCTGGLIAGTITNVPGISAYFQEGIVTYSNEAKQKYLHVSKETLDTYGAVSAQTAKEMVIGILNASKAALGIAVTGIAGPDGGTKEKPVGLVYIGYGSAKKPQVEECHFNGNREEVRKQTVTHALKLLIRFIEENYS
jgi:nicotinamide-nucleotide amidase